MKTEVVAQLAPLERFLYWIRERHSIHLKRAAGLPAPWTDDRVLQTNFFTNPYRENDKVTVWFRENIREPLRYQRAVLMATVIFRWFNHIYTGEQLLKYPTKTSHGAFTDWNPKAVADRLHGLHGHGAQIFTGAYVVNARSGPKNGPSRTKIDVVCERINNVWKDRDLIYQRICPGSLQNAHRVLSEYPGLGGTGFSAYEIITDLRHTAILEEADDVNTWCNPGPGAIRGLSLLCGKPEPKSGKDRFKGWELEMQKLIEKINDRLLGDMPRFEMREVEHSLCEWYKYERARNGGRSKRTYNGVA